MNNIITLAHILQDPWSDSEDIMSNGLLDEAKKEIHYNHILSGKTLTLVARRVDNDDILVFLPDTHEYAIIHLTWKWREEQGIYPITEIIVDIGELKNRIKIDATEYLW